MVKLHEKCNNKTKLHNYTTQWTNILESGPQLYRKLFPTLLHEKLVTLTVPSGTTYQHL